MSDKIHLSIDSVTKIYRGGSSDGSADVRALNEVSLQVPQGQFLAVMGASGSGKSTLLHVAAGLTKPTRGSIRIGETEISTLSDRQLTLFRRQKVGIVFQAFNLIPTLTAEENILLPILAGGGLSGISGKIGEAMEEILRRLNLLERRHHYPDALSGGEQQRTAIARALFMDFVDSGSQNTLLFADEPTGNLDTANSEVICRLLRELCTERHHTMVVVTHESAVAKYADRVIVLQDGRILRDETAEQFALTVQEG